MGEAPRCKHGNYCERLPGHKGGHATQSDTCNRSAGHEGNHMILTLDAKRLVEWPERSARVRG